MGTRYARLSAAHLEQRAQSHLPVAVLTELAREAASASPETRLTAAG